MGQIDNLNDPYARTRDMKRQQRRAAHATPGNNMSIGRDGLLVYGGGSITIDNNGGITITGPDGQIVGSGTIEWTGTFTNTGQTNLNGPTAVTGDTTVTGPFHVQGATDITGDTTVVGPFHVQGATDITGTLAVKGATELDNDLTVNSGGRITVGALVLDPAVSGAGTVGGITASGTLLLSAPTVVLTGGGQVDGLLNAAGGVSLTNLPMIPGKTSNLYIDPNDLYKLKIIV